MSNQQIIDTLKRAGVRTLGDLDSWARVRGYSRQEALGVLVGVEAADLILGLLAVRMARGDHFKSQYQTTGDRGGALL
jgi:hypothetical protein